MILFDGRDIKVVGRRIQTTGGDLVITFTGRAANPPVEKGFGETYLDKRGIPAIHFISKKNHWWQTPETVEALEALRVGGFLEGRRLTLYGSSMGGYAAMRFSRLLKPYQVIVFSPQFSIDGTKVPFEARWRNYAAKLDFSEDNMAEGIDPDTRMLVLFDPMFKPDAQHVEMFEKLRPVERVVIPFAGHNTARLLSEIGIITSVTGSLIQGQFDYRQFARMYRRDRVTGALFWHGLAETLRAHRRPAAAVLAALAAARLMLKLDRMSDRTLRLDILHSCLAAALELERPELAQAMLDHVLRLDAASARSLAAQAAVARAFGRLEEAHRLAEAALASQPHDAAAMAGLADALSAIGQAEAALAVLDRAPPKLQAAPRLLLARARLQVAAGQWEDAKATLRRFCRLEGRNAEARVMLARCWAQTGREDAAEVQLRPILSAPIASPRLAREAVLLLECGGSRSLAATTANSHAKYSQACDAITSLGEERDWSINPHAMVTEIRAALRRASSGAGL